MGSPIKDIAGLRFSHVVVEGRAVRPASTAQTGAFWTIQCDCGSKGIAEGKDLRKGKRQTCGQASCPYLRALRPQASPDSVAISHWKGYKRGAEVRKLDFSLTLEEFQQITTQACHYCGESPVMTYQPGTSALPRSYNGIDRKDNTQGYCISNALPCCKTCNFMKRADSYDDFINQVMKIANHMKSGT